MYWASQFKLTKWRYMGGHYNVLLRHAVNYS